MSIRPPTRWARSENQTRRWEANAAAVDFGQIFAGPSIQLLFGDPTKDPRVPDVVVQPNVGVIYTGSTSDTRTQPHIPLKTILSSPVFRPQPLDSPCYPRNG